MKFQFIIIYRTALHSAVENEEVDVVKLLLTFKGIDISIKNEISFFMFAWNFIFILMIFYIFFLWKTPFESTENEDIKKLFNELNAITK